MANINISNLAEKTTVNDNDVLLVEDASSTNKVTKANLLKEVNAKIPTKVSQLTNDSGYLTSIPSEYITESELSSKGYLTAVPEEYVTETELSSKGFITEHQDISGKVDKIPGKGLSTNDYTSEEKEKLAGVSQNANNYSLPMATDSVLGGIKVSLSDPNLQISEGVLTCKKDIPDVFTLPKLIKVDALAGESELATVITAFNNLIADLKAKGYMSNS
ncbi:MAG TPA: hypothetical protein K8V90_06880 [Romboutsia timonensis]|uniref:Head fiber protein n=1 Tax=Romboutsia timonensis TaxID=1776391 RepID=A0A921SZS0_9FIRM|nr:hypothetical protein [Romboutsia timonensis]